MNTSHKIRIILIGILAAAASVATYAQPMKVVVKDVSATSGTIRVSVFNTADSFLKEPVAIVVVRATQGQVTAEFTGLANGTYALSVVHDANNNQVLDSNFMGMPTEGFGFSNDAMGLMGPPNFKKAAFAFSGQQQIVVTMRYL